MSTIKDVAKIAGVSISTASYALNNSSKVSEETRSKILRVAEELEYHPNGNARNLKKRKTETIGLFLNDLGGPFYSEVTRAIQEITASQGYDLIACSNYGGKESTAYKFLKEKRVDGAIIMAPAITDDVILQVARPNFPVIVLDRELNADFVHSVLIANDRGAYEAVSHLVGLGYKKIGYLSGVKNSYDNMKRFDGYKRTLMENKLYFNQEWCISGKFTENGGYDAMKSLIMTQNLPEAIFAANDEMAIGAIKALNENGIRVPEDIAIAGFDDIRLASYITPKLTTVMHPKYELGVVATHMIFRILKGETVNKSVTLSTSLIVRDSCGEKLQK